MTSHLVSKVGKELAGYQVLRGQLEKGFDLDPQTLLDTLEGETDLHEALLVVAEQIEETESLQAGLNYTIERLQIRQGRQKKSNETLRNVVLSAMDKAGLDTIKGPLCTLTRRKTPAQAIIDEESDIPSRFFKSVPPKLDRKAVKTALDEKEDIPGAHLSNGGIALTMRVK